MSSRWSRVVAFALSAVCLTGCATVMFQAGRPLQDEDWRDTLRVGRSSREDVLRVLGEPVGRGRALLPIDEGDAPRTVLTYYYEQATMQDARRLFLFIFLDGDRYDGYLWFSSLPAPAR